MCKHWCILQSQIIKCQVKKRHGEGEHYAQITFDVFGGQTSYKTSQGDPVCSNLEVEVRW